MRDEITIRFVEQTDLSALVALCADHAAYEKAPYDPAGKAALLAEGLFCDPPKLFCLVAEQKGKLVGFLSYMQQYATWDAGTYVYMDCLYIDQRARNLGLGKQLVSQLVTEARKMGCTLIQWQTPAFNTGAIRFYERLGATSKSKERFFLGT
ncbi:MAG: GNAT family N-acetyltransferase [Bacteroidota bacterium]